MIRGTTPTFEITVDNLDMLYDIELSFSQNNASEPVVRKTFINGEITKHDGFIRCRLTQEETFMFTTGTARVQMRVIGNNGSVSATDVERIRVDESLSNKELKLGQQEG